MLESLLFFRKSAIKPFPRFVRQTKLVVKTWILSEFQHLQLDEALAKMQALIVRCSLGNREFVWAACVLPAILLCPCVQRGSHHGAGVALAVPFSSFLSFFVFA